MWIQFFFLLRKNSFQKMIFFSWINIELSWLEKLMVNTVPEQITLLIWSLRVQFYFVNIFLDLCFINFDGGWEKAWVWKIAKLFISILCVPLFLIFLNIEISFNNYKNKEKKKIFPWAHLLLTIISHLKYSNCRCIFRLNLKSHQLKLVNNLEKSNTLYSMRTWQYPCRELVFNFCFS